MHEGNEEPNLWSVFGQRRDPASQVVPRKDPRLFLCSIGSGSITVEECIYVVQENLDSNHVMILDSFYEIFVWFGDNSMDIEQRIAIETAMVTHCNHLLRLINVNF